MKHLGLIFLALAVIILLISSNAFCDDTEISRLLRAKSVARLDLIRESAKNLERTRRICSVQLRDGLLPSACFTVLELERKRGILNPEQARRQSWLETLCVDRAASITRLELIERGSVDLPEQCRAVAMSRAEDIRYQHEVSAPEKLFAGRFSDHWSGF